MGLGIYHPEGLDSSWNGGLVKEAFAPRNPDPHPWKHDVIHCMRPPKPSEKFRRAMCPIYATENVNEDGILRDIEQHENDAAHLTIIRLDTEFREPSSLCRHLLTWCQMQHRRPLPLYSPPPGFSWEIHHSEGMILHCQLKFPESYKEACDVSLQVDFRCELDPTLKEAHASLELEERFINLLGYDPQGQGGQTNCIVRNMKRPQLKSVLSDLLLHIPELGFSQFGAVAYHGCSDTSTVIHPLSIFASFLRVLSNLDEHRLAAVKNDSKLTSQHDQIEDLRMEDFYENGKYLNELNREISEMSYRSDFLQSVASQMVNAKLFITSKGSGDGVNLASFIDSIQQKQQQGYILPLEGVDRIVSTTSNPWSPLLPQFTRTLAILHQVLIDSKRRQSDIESVQRSMAISLAATANDWSEAVAEATRRESSAMTILAALGAVFLPASFISSFFAIPLFDWDSWSSPINGERSTPMRPGFWIFWAATLPLTAFIVILVAVLWNFWVRNRKKRHSIEEGTS